MSTSADIPAFDRNRRRRSDAQDELASARRDAVYLDSSALVKLVAEESESQPLRNHLERSGRRVSCALVRVEVIRAARTQGPAVVERAREVVDGLHVVLQLDDQLLAAASDLDPVILRSLDAIHVAAALAIRGALRDVITYDTRMADAARAVGLTVVAPGT